jgi:hypothetical protein
MKNDLPRPAPPDGECDVITAESCPAMAHPKSGAGNPFVAAAEVQPHRRGDGSLPAEAPAVPSLAITLSAGASHSSTEDTDMDDIDGTYDSLRDRDMLRDEKVDERPDATPIATGPVKQEPWRFADCRKMTGSGPAWRW